MQPNRIRSLIIFMYLNFWNFLPTHIWSNATHPQNSEVPIHLLSNRMI